MEIEGLSVVCAGLGCASQDADGRRNGYIKSENCLENLKDLQRFLRRDHPQTRDVFKQLGKWNTVSQDLIPIIDQYRNETELVMNTVKVIVFLTMPIDPSSDDISLQMEYLWSFKASFSCNDVIAVIVSLLEEPLEHLECGSFTEDDWKVIQLVLTLFRNLLAIRDPSPQQMTGRSNSQFQFLRDGFLEHLFHENVMDLLLALTQHVAGSHGFLKQDNLLFLEIFHYIFSGQQPELVATMQQKILKSDTKSHRLSGTLRSMMEEEEEQRRLLRLRDLPRHSQFSGTFVRLAPDGSKRIVKRNPFITPAESILKTCQIKRGPIKRIACDTSSPVSSKNSVLGLLQHFADQFLDSGYNVLMQSVREDIRKEHPSIQTSDIIVFFEVAHFFTAYQRFRVSNCKAKTGSAEVNECNKEVLDTVYRGLICAPIASTMNEPTFNMVISKWHYAFETLKETHDLKSLTTAGALIKEMIHMLDLVLKISRNGSREREHEARTARILLYKVFYDQTENGISQFLRTLIKSFDYHKQPRSHLADLVEITHIMLRLMDALKEADGTLRVLKKTQKGRKKKKMADSQQDTVQSGGNSGLQDATEDASKMRDYHDEKITDGTAEFHKEKDNSDVHTDVAEQGGRLFKDDRDRKVQHNSSLNNADECEEEEIECMEENCDDRSENLPDDIEGISEDDNHAGRIEANFDIAKYISSFADNTIIQNYCWLLKFYKTNSPATNHYIIRMLQRICDDCMLAPMLYQLSLFCTFYEILSDQKTLQSDRYKSIVEFLTKLIRTFFKKMKTQPFLLLEILFWKTRRECNLISTDHLLSEMNKLKSKGDSSKERGLAGALGDDEADGTNMGKSTVGSYKRNLAEALGDDEAGLPLDELDHHENKTLGKERNRRSPKKRKSLIFNDELEAQIKELFEQYKGNRRCSHMIAEALHSDGKISAVQVSRKLKQLGLKVGSNKQKSRVVELFNDEDDETADEVEDGVLDKPLSVGIHGKTGRKRQILDSEDESEDATQQTDLLQKTSRKRQFLDSEDEQDETKQNDQISERKNSVLKHKKKSPKKRKSFVPSEEQDSLVKELFEQHKENRKCSRLIAESVGLTVAQVNQRLKLLGLKATLRKRESGIVKISSEKVTSRKQKSGVVKHYDDEEFRNCSRLIAEAIGLPVAQVKRRLKMLSFKASSRISKSGVKHSTDKDDETTVGVADADNSDNEPLMTKLLESQNMRIQKGNRAEECNKPVKKSGVDEHLSGKDDEIAVGQGDDDEEIKKCSRLIGEAVGLPVTQVERKLMMLSLKVTSRKSSSGVKQSTNKDDEAAVGVGEADVSDDEPLMTKLVKSQNMRIQEENMSEACNKDVNNSGVDEHLCHKDYENTQGVGDGDNLDDEILMTRLLKAFEKKKSLVKDKNNKSPRRQKSFPSSGEQEGLIKDLFKQHKENVKCSSLIAEAVGISVAQVKRKLKMLGLSVTSRKAKSRVFENFTDKTDKAAVGVEDEDTSDNEPLAAKLFKGQNMKVHKAKTTEACNEPGKKSAVAEHVSDKDVETAAGVGDKADSDDEPLMTKLLIAQNMKGHKARTIEACNESVKKSGAASHVRDNNNENAAGLGGQDDSDDEALVMRLLKSKDTALETTDANRKIDNIKELDDELDDELLKGHLVKSRLEKLSSTKIGKAGGFNNTNRSQVDLGDLSDLETGTSLGSMADITPSGKTYDVNDSILATENGVRDTNALPQDKKHSRKENWRALSVEDDSLYKSYKKMEDESVVLEDNVEMDIEENISKGDNNDSSAEEHVTEMFEGKTMFSRGKRKMHMITEDDE